MLKCKKQISTCFDFKLPTEKSCYNQKINYQHAYSQIRLEKEQVTIRNQRFNMKTKDSLIKFIFPNIPTTSYLGYISHADRLESKLSHCRGIRRMKIRESVCR